MKKSIRIVSLLLSVSLVTTLSGCSSEEETESYRLKYTPSSEIELEEPCYVPLKNERVERRDIYDVKSYECTAFPYSEEYSFWVNADSFEYYVTLGEEVTQGQTLAKASSEEITEYEEKLETLKAEYEAIVSEYETENQKEMSEERQFLLDSLFELEKEHYENEISRLEMYSFATTITAGFDGTVSEVLLTTQTNVRSGGAVIAVSDDSRMLLKTDKVNSTSLRGAEETYALINGEVYAVSLLSRPSSGTNSYFEIIDPKGVSYGDYAQLIILNASVFDVISVNNEYIREDTLGRYVYVNTDNGNEKRYITTGYTDGVFTEVTKGLAEGDTIADTQAPEVGLKTAQVEYREVSSTYNKRGYLMSPEVDIVTNPIENGRVIFKEFKVEAYDIVNEGDVICTVSVEGDEMVLMRLKRQLQRLEERNADKEEIEALREQIGRIEQDYATVEIRAPYSGLIGGLSSLYEGDVIEYDAKIAEIASRESCYVAFPNSGLEVYYGQQVDVIYSLTSTEKVEIKGVIANVGNQIASSSLRSDYTLVRISAEDSAEILSRINNYMSRQSITVKGDKTGPSYALCVPKNAVTLSDGKCLVTVVDENGEAVKKSFTPSGKDNDYYYVLFGLEEGETVCLK